MPFTLPTSSYFTYPQFDVREPPELRNCGGTLPVVIIGAGPVGMTIALDLANRGIPVTLIERLTTIGDGSRAGSISKRSIEILERVGAAERLLRKGLTYDRGWVYYKDREVFRLSIPGLDGDQHPPMLKIQQVYIEEALADLLQAHPAVDVRWGTELVGIRQEHGAATLDLRCPFGSYELAATHVIATDGARSSVRRFLGLALEGVTYPAAFVIADVKMDFDAEAGRRVWFDPPWNRGGSVIMHRQPDDIWRLDYQIDRDPQEVAIPDEADVVRTIQAHFDWIGYDGDWSLEWQTLYSAHSRRLANFRCGRVVFAGDAAHLVPIFGVRGLNGGLLDASLLPWRMARVVAGTSPERVLDAYAAEAEAAADYNQRMAHKSALVMCPAGVGTKLLRQAVLQLAIDHDFVRPLLDPRQSSAVSFDSQAARAGTTGSLVLPGDPLPNLRLPSGTGTVYLHNLIGTDFTVLRFVAGSAPGISTTSIELDGESLREVTVMVPSGRRIDDSLGELIGSELLLRPDCYVAGRWLIDESSRLQVALAAARGEVEPAATVQRRFIDDTALEQVFMTLSTALDSLAPDRIGVFLASLVLLQAGPRPDRQSFNQLVASAHHSTEL